MQQSHLSERGGPGTALDKDKTPHQTQTLPWGGVTPEQAEIKSLSEGAADLDPQEESTAAPYSLYERIRQSARTGPGARGGERGAGSGGIEESLAPAPNP